MSTVNILSRLLHLSVERQIQSPECEEKFTQSFRLLNKLRKMATQAQRDRKLDLKVFQKEEKEKIKTQEERRGVIHVWSITDDVFAW